MAREAGLVQFSENEECRFLGPSSGIAITRFVMDFARRNATRKTIKEVVSQQSAQEIKNKFESESSKPTSKVYPLISSVAAPDLPNRELMEQLVNIYMVKAQYMSPLLHEPSFKQELNKVYNGTTDPTLNFQVRMVVAISMQKLDTQYAGLADSYYLAALPFLTGAIQKKDLSTLQCYALIAQYSLLTPTRTAAYWVVGMATKLCQELGFCEESTIEASVAGSRPDFLEVDMRRRLFWIIMSMEYGLSHSLGRPSAFGVSVDNLDVRFFQQCDDRFITPEGLLPGHHPIMKKCIAIHFLKMRVLQAEIRKTLYLKKRPTPISDQDPWFADILRRIDDWVTSSPHNDEGSGLSPAWFTGRKNTMIVFLYRPSPQIPNPSLDAAMKAYDASIFNIHLQKKQVEARLIDITWIFTQSINMALNTVLWSISYAAVRQLHPLHEVRSHIDAALEAISMCADRWPGVRSAVQLYENLIQSCLKAYDSDRVAESPYSDNLSSVQDVSSAVSQVAQSPSSVTSASIYGAQSPQTMNALPATTQALKAGHQGASMTNMGLSPASASGMSAPHSATSVPYYMPVSGQTTSTGATHYSLPTFDPFQSAMPMGGSVAQWNHPVTSTAASMGFPQSPDFAFSTPPWLPAFGDEYSRYLHQAYGPSTNEMQSLSEQQQMELMQSLEHSQLPDVSNMVSDATTYYTVGLP
ncbi:Positive regulator of purine utilization [Cyphellophora attinorum]|uniref:Positive regulator of purine utilization n=1 Tax=Cyphellophora attinorum TaxID=1664694 RepID=A0A0N1H5Z6_9EURO|nr:Positive regulator of purine utilization [Phialophora attinorum]KPI37982.1 Positive regulator of purine utilization [Phialophora attinorum]